MRSKIYYNLGDSDFLYHDNKTHLDFYFSSNLYLRKFLNLKENYVELESYKLSSKYNFDYPLDFRAFFLIALYKKIEKRGFYVNYKNDDLKDYFLFRADFVI